MGKKRGTKNWTDLQVDRLLDAVQELLPSGNIGWENVKNRFNEGRPPEFPERDMESLRRKFKLLKNHPKPTGKKIELCVN
jgi:hypothetical protein